MAAGPPNGPLTTGPFVSETPPNAYTFGAGFHKVTYRALPRPLERSHLATGRQQFRAASSGQVWVQVFPPSDVVSKYWPELQLVFPAVHAFCSMVTVAF